MKADRGPEPKSKRAGSVVFSKPSLLGSTIISNGPNEMFQGLKQGIIRLCILQWRRKA